MANVDDEVATLRRDFEELRTGPKTLIRNRAQARPIDQIIPPAMQPPWTCEPNRFRCCGKRSPKSSGPGSGLMPTKRNGWSGSLGG